MIENTFKSLSLLTNAFKPYVLEESKNLFRSDQNLIESEISDLDIEEREKYRDHYYQKIQQMIDLDDIENPENNEEIQKYIEYLSILANYDTFISSKIFLYIVKFGSKLHLLDTVFTFMVSSFKQNPALVNQYLCYNQENIITFIYRFSRPFNQNHFDWANILINKSQQNCDELVILGIVDQIQKGILDLTRSNKDFSQYWILALKILDEIAKNCTANILLFNSIGDMCFIFLNDTYSPCVVLQSIECLITISSRIDDKDFLLQISEFLPFFDDIINENANVEEVKPIVKLITIISTKYINDEDIHNEIDSDEIIENDKILVDLYKNQFIQHMIEVSIEWDENQFEPVFEDIYKMLTFVLRYHPKLIIDIVNSNILNLAVFYFNNGGTTIKNEVLLFFSRLCNEFFWDYVCDFFEENYEFVSSLFLLLQTDISIKSKTFIIHALTSLAISLKEKTRIMPNMISQYELQSSIDAYNEVQECEEESIADECIHLNRAVNDLIQDVE